MISSNKIPIIIVAYKNVQDVGACLDAIRKLSPHPAFDVYICENGGTAAFAALVAALKSGGLCDSADLEIAPASLRCFVRAEALSLRGTSARVLVGEAKENLGYAGAINCWVRILMERPDWPGIWILNPDTQPEPRALAELVDWSAARGKGMVGSRIVPAASPEIIQSRGLRWRPFRASTEAVAYHAPAAIEPVPDDTEARIDAASGASMYVTRPCMESVGLMDERYFLLFEDLDWGYRAKKTCGIGYAYRSIVPHHGGTTLGSSGRRSAQSPLSVYLEFRNRVHFIRRYHRAWLPWSLAVLLLRPFEYAMVGAYANMRIAFRGLFRGLAGETGRPDAILKTHVR